MLFVSFLCNGASVIGRFFFKLLQALFAGHHILRHLSDQVLRSSVLSLPDKCCLGNEPSETEMPFEYINRRLEITSTSNYMAKAPTPESPVAQW